MNRVFNFSAGPSVLPQSVLEKAASQMLNYGGTGMSVMEMSHRSDAFNQIRDQAEERLRHLMEIPENYEVLFLQGGASLQFSMVPMNLFRSSRRADYVLSGVWSKKAAAEAEKLGRVRVVADGAADGYRSIPDLSPEGFDAGADYAHITTNNTIAGTCYSQLPATGELPLVADMSSDILSRPYPVHRFGLIYAGAQKNLGPAGLTVVIIRRDLIGLARQDTPSMLNYDTHVRSRSLYNTPPCFAIYMADLVFQWLIEQGGIPAIYQRNREKAALLYEFLDDSQFYKANIDPAHRSIVNIPFTLADSNLDQQFLADAAGAGLVNLKGHRSVGGMRASLYNGMPRDGVVRLIEFMAAFEKEYHSAKMNRSG